MYITLVVSKCDLIAIGCSLGKENNGTSEEMDEALESGEKNYFVWLSSKSTFFEFKGLKMEYYTLEDGRACFTANKCGLVYYPMTRALEAKGIDWDEV